MPCGPHVTLIISVRCRSLSQWIDVCGLSVSDRLGSVVGVSAVSAALMSQTSLDRETRSGHDGQEWTGVDMMDSSGQDGQDGQDGQEWTGVDKCLSVQDTLVQCLWFLNFLFPLNQTSAFNETTEQQSSPLPPPPLSLCPPHRPPLTLSTPACFPLSVSPSLTLSSLPLSALRPLIQHRDSVPWWQ